MGERRESLFERDYLTWREQQREALRAGEPSELSIPYLLDDLVAYGMQPRAQVAAVLDLLVLYLAKTSYHPDGRSRPSWQAMIEEQGAQLALHVEHRAWLRAELDEQLRAAWTRTRRQIARETGIPLPRIPHRLPEAIRDEARAAMDGTRDA